MSRPKISTLILLRHGESIWNGAPETRFTGWCDVPLTVKGRVEAVGAGQLLRSRGFRAANIDVAFTSELQRAHETCQLALASMAGPCQDTWSTERIRRDVRLNERHYGALQGYRKCDPTLLSRFGDDVVWTWRRSMDGKPPPMGEGHEHWQAPPAPLTESLADCQARVIDCFNDRIAHAMWDEADPESLDRTVVVVAHSNTIRSLMAHFDNVPNGEVPQLHVPNSVPILYRFHRDSRELISTKLQSAAGHSHARWLLSPENHAQIRGALQPGGMLTRALFDSWDVSGSRKLSIAEIETGLQTMVAHDGENAAKCGIIAVAKKIVRELSANPHATVTLAEFEELAALSASEIQMSIVRQNRNDMLGEVPGYF